MTNTDNATPDVEWLVKRLRAWNENAGFSKDGLLVQAADALEQLELATSCLEAIRGVSECNTAEEAYHRARQLTARVASLERQLQEQTTSADKRIAELEPAAKSFHAIQDMLKAFAEASGEDVDEQELSQADAYLNVYQRVTEERDTAQAEEQITAGLLADAHANEKRLREDASKYFDIMDALRQSQMEHGDCNSGERYGGVPKACTACMAQRKLDEAVKQYKGRRVALAEDGHE